MKISQHVAMLHICLCMSQSSYNEVLLISVILVFIYSSHSLFVSKGTDWICSAVIKVCSLNPSSSYFCTWKLPILVYSSGKKHNSMEEKLYVFCVIKQKLKFNTNDGVVIVVLSLKSVKYSKVSFMNVLMIISEFI